MKAETKRLLAKTTLTPAEVVKELTAEIKQYHDSYEEGDGVVRDDDVLKTMSALRRAKAIVVAHYKKRRD